MFKTVPTIDMLTGEWSHTEFDTRESFKDFLWSLFKVPGDYGFNEYTSKYCREQAARFEKDGFYCISPRNTKDFVNYWNTEKEKNRQCVIFKLRGT